MNQYPNNPQNNYQQPANYQQPVNYQANVQRPVQPAWQQPVYQAPQQNPESLLPPKYKPLSPWAYVGYSLLFSIPLVGFIFLIMYSVNDDNINRRNFARSIWCAILISVAVTIVVTIISLIAGASLFAGLKYYS